MEGSAEVNYLELSSVSTFGRQILPEYKIKNKEDIFRYFKEYYRRPPYEIESAYLEAGIESILKLKAF